MFCYIAFTLAGSLRRCLSLSASCSNTFLRSRQMLMNEKTCVIPILFFLPNRLNRCFACSKEQFYWDDSFEHPQHTSWLFLSFTSQSTILSVMLWKFPIFLGCTSTKQRIKCLLQSTQNSDSTSGQSRTSMPFDHSVKCSTNRATVLCPCFGWGIRKINFDYISRAPD